MNSCSSIHVLHNCNSSTLLIARKAQCTTEDTCSVTYIKFNETYSVSFLTQYLHLFVTRLPEYSKEFFRWFRPQFSSSTIFITHVTDTCIRLQQFDMRSRHLFYIHSRSELLHTENTSEFILDYSLPKIANKKGIAWRIIFCILQNKI